jgi:predicted nucleic acid-binding Zn ribbon protein
MPKGTPQPIADVLAQLLARRGYARQTAAANCEAAWREAVGESLAKVTRPGNIRRGVLEVLVANSTLLQELAFQKTQLLDRLGQSAAADESIRDLRFRVGRIE